MTFLLFLPSLNISPPYGESLHYSPPLRIWIDPVVKRDRVRNSDKAKLELVRQSEAEQWQLLPGVSSRLKPPLEKVKCRLENSRRSFEEGSEADLLSCIMSTA